MTTTEQSITSTASPMNQAEKHFGNNPADKNAMTSEGLTIFMHIGKVKT